MNARMLLSGASRYLGSVLVGVLFAPVLPDVAVDLWGADGRTNALLRTGAVLLVMALCVAVYAAQLRWTARRARRTGAVLDRLGRRDVLVAPISLGSSYTRPRGRSRPNSVVDWLVDTIVPSLVVLVATPETAQVVARMRAELQAEGIDVVAVELADVADADKTVPEAERLLVPLLAARARAGTDCYFDTTGGTVPMSLAMIRVAAVVGADCAYVASDFRDRKPVPGTQRGTAFRPTDLFTAAP